MRIVVGHANPDFDAYASTVAATKLYPGAVGVFLGTQNANVRAFHNLHEEFLDFVDLKELDPDLVDSVVMVDTRDPDRIGEIGEIARRPDVEVIVYDHHPAQEGDLHSAQDHSLDVGATTSILVHEIRQRAIDITPLEASVMLLGVHEDTGSLTYPGSTAFDAEAAAFLMGAGADIEVLNQFLIRALEPAQARLLDQLQRNMAVWNVHGQQVAVGTADSPEYVDSAAVLTHYVVEDMGFRVALGVIEMPERLQIVARSRVAEVDVGAVMSRLGGGGHPQAASARLRDTDVEGALVLLREALEAEVKSPLCAEDVMSKPVRVLAPGDTMRDAGVLMTRWGHGGLPVVEAGHVVGIITRKDVDKAATHGLDHAPVTGFISREMVTVVPKTPLPELERLLASRGIGRLPVLEGGALVGIVTRKDVLRAEHGDEYLDRRLVRAHPDARARFIQGVEQLPEDARLTLHKLGEIADEAGVRAHVVGGFVRDMVLGRKNLDIDIVIEGDGLPFAEKAGERLGVRVKEHRRFGTAVLVVSKELHVDVASSRSEYYTRPGALPTVEQSNLRQDLFRRDFTINAMAACIDPKCFGQIADPFGGLRDLQSGTVRVLHGLSYVDDPTRVLRAVRFEKRYHFRMDEWTESQARQAVNMGLLGEVSGARIREELIDIFDERDPAGIFERLGELGALEHLLPTGSLPERAAERVRSVEDALVHLHDVLPHAHKRIVIAAALAGPAPRFSVERWLRHERFGREYSAVLLDLAQKRRGVLKALRDRRGMRDSRLYRLLRPLSAEALVVLWSEAGDMGRSRIERYLREVSKVKPQVTGRDLLGMGYAPDPEFAAILARALDDRLDGRAVGREEEVQNLRRIALRVLGKPDVS